MRRNCRSSGYASGNSFTSSANDDIVSEEPTTRPVTPATSTDGWTAEPIADGDARQGSPSKSSDDDWVVKPTNDASDYVWEFPMEYRINWVAVAMLLFYVGASVAYFQFRIATVRDLGHYTG